MPSLLIVETKNALVRSLILPAILSRPRINLEKMRPITKVVSQK